MQRNGTQTKDVGDDANLLSHSFDVLLALFSQLSVPLKLCMMNTLCIFC